MFDMFFPLRPATTPAYGSYAVLYNTCLEHASVMAPTVQVAPTGSPRAEASRGLAACPPLSGGGPPRWPGGDLFRAPLSADGRDVRSIRPWDVALRLCVWGVSVRIPSAVMQSFQVSADLLGLAGPPHPLSKVAEFVGA